MWRYPRYSLDRRLGGPRRSLNAIEKRKIYSQVWNSRVYFCGNVFSDPLPSNGHGADNIENTSCSTFSIVACAYFGRCLEMGRYVTTRCVLTAVVHVYVCNELLRCTSIVVHFHVENFDKYCIAGTRWTAHGVRATSRTNDSSLSAFLK
jgi:hypothetical protein